MASIQITHFKNPHTFWFKYLQSNNDEQVQRIEYELRESIPCPIDKQNCHIGEIIAIRWIERGKWIRACIDQVDSEHEEVIVWAIDYGEPIRAPIAQTSSIEAEIKELCKTTKSSVCVGGVYGIMPQTKRSHVAKGQWDPKASVQFEKIRHNHFQFIERFKKNHHIFGELVVDNNAKQRSVASIFIEMQCAISVDNFESAAKELQTENQRSFDCTNNRKAIKNETGTILSNTKNCATPNGESTSVDSIFQILRQLKPARKPLPRIDQHLQVKKNHSKFRIKLGPDAESQMDNGNDSSLMAVARSRKPTIRIKSMESVAPIINHAVEKVVAAPAKNKMAEFNEGGLIDQFKHVHILDYNNVEQPISKVAEACFTNTVHRGMAKLHLNEIYGLQSYAWPNILRSNSCIIVNSQRTGKTIGYLPGLCSLVERALIEDTVAGGSERISNIGATAIIVCLTSYVSAMANTCKLLLPIPKFSTHIVKATGTHNWESLVTKLYNGIEILIITPALLLRCMEKSKLLLSNGKLKMVAFENLDLMYERHKDVCDSLLQHFASINKLNRIQTVVTSSTWHRILWRFLNNDTPAIIGNCLEAALFAQTNIELELCGDDAKLDKLCENIRNASSKKILIICNTDEETYQIAGHFNLTEIKYRILGADEQKSSDFGASNYVVICTDATLMGASIQDAEYIINFTIPHEEFRMLLWRFSAQMTHYKNYDPLCKESKPIASCCIFIDSSNLKQLPKLMDLLKRGNHTIPENLTRIIEASRMENKKQKAQWQQYETICNYVFVHGQPHYQKDCRNRHSLLPYDVLDEPFAHHTQYLRFQLLNLISPTEYVIRPLEVKCASGWQTINSSDKYGCEFSPRFLQYYNKAQNQYLQTAIKVGDLAVTFDSDIPYRCEVIKCRPKIKIIDDESFDVRLIDTGVIVTRRSLEIFVLHNKFKDFPRQAYVMHLAGIIPTDHEDDFADYITSKLRILLTELEKKSENWAYEAEILFSLRSSFVAKMIRAVDDRFGIIYAAISNHMIEKQWAIHSTENLKKAIELAKEYGVNFEKLHLVEKVRLEEEPDIEGKPDVEQELENHSINSIADTTISTAEKSANLIEFSDSSISSINEKPTKLVGFPDSSTLNAKEKLKLKEGDDNEWPVKTMKQICVPTFYSPDHLYLNIKSKRVCEMYAKIDEYDEQTIKTQPKGETTLGLDWDINEPCLVRSNGLLNRGVLVDVTMDADSCVANVFFIDTGETFKYDTEDVHRIPDALTDIMPPQAIRCCLYGICSVADSKTWSANDIDGIYDLIKDSSQHGLNAYAVAKQSTKSEILHMIDQQYLQVILLDANNKNINETAVKMNLAKFDKRIESKFYQICSELKVIEEAVDDIAVNEADDSDWEDLIDEKNIKLTKCASKFEPKNDSNEIDIDELEDNMSNDEAEAFMAQLMGKKEPKPSSEMGKKPLDEIKPNEDLQPNETIETHDESSKATNGDLVYEYKRPIIYWQQTEDYIRLKISSFDSCKYNLEVGSDSFVYRTLDEEDNPIVAKLVLFGCIQQEETTHKLSGLTVTVMLRKSCDFLWPRLIKSSYKCNWIQADMTRYGDKLDDFDDYVKKFMPEDEPLAHADEDNVSLDEKDLDEYGEELCYD